MSEPHADHAHEWRQRIAALADFVRRRADGDYEVDESGFDPDFHASVIMPLSRAVYREWFRVRMRGLEHVPDTGPALIVANHSGVLPFDAIMLHTGLFDEHPSHRNLRLLGADLCLRDPRPGEPCQEERAYQGRPSRGRATAGGWRARRRVSRGLQGNREALQRAVPAAALWPWRVRGDGDSGRGAYHPVRDRRRRGDLSNDRECRNARPNTPPPVFPGHAAISVARCARCHTTAIQVDYRILSAGAGR